MDKEIYTFEDLLHIVKRLRAKDGCAWDRAQTHESLKSCMKEEAYEVIEAIEQGDMQNLEEELGDVLLQVVMHSEIAQEEEVFTINGVITGICKKLVRRHPHVFGSVTAQSEQQALENWDVIKRAEKKEKTPLDSMKRIPIALPACIRAQKAQKYAEKAGYVFEAPIQQLGREEVGERLFALLNEARILGIDGEEALEEYTKKFVMDRIENK